MLIFSQKLVLPVMNRTLAA